MNDTPEPTGFVRANATLTKFVGQHGPYSLGERRYVEVVFAGSVVPADHPIAVSDPQYFEPVDPNESETP